MALHGFTLTGEMFEPLGARTDLDIHAPDLPGHGSTTVRPTITSAVVALAAYLTEHGPMPVVGYSQGGRIGLQLAIDHPDLVPLLILVSVSFGIKNPVERADRAAADRALASSIRNSTIDAFVKRWLSHPVAAPCGLDNATRSWDRSVRLKNTTAGLADALEGMGQGQHGWLGDQAHDLPMPVVCVTGARDAAYSSIASRWCEEARSGGPSRCHVVVQNAGHNLVVERPDHFGPLIANLVTPCE